VLVYCAELVVTSQMFLRHLLRKGVVAFQEANLTFTVKPVPPSPCSMSNVLG
jgi:hypothetical protein